jgi:hypothetical protein
MSSIAASNKPERIPMLEYVRRMLAEAEAKEKCRHRGDGQVISFQEARIRLRPAITLAATYK